jgi:hypothetical protein
VAELRTLTVKPPWSHLIAKCGKLVENRGWPARFRGLLAIHAGLGWDAAAERDTTALAAWRDWSASLPHPNITGPLRKSAIHVDLGAVVAVAELSGCHDSEECMLPAWSEVPGVRSGCSDWAARGQFHWTLRQVRPLPVPVPCKGKLGLWRLPEDVEKAVRAQLAPLLPKEASS